MSANLIAGKAIAQTVMVAATASEGSKDDRDNLAMTVLLWLRQRYRKFPDRLHLLDVGHELIKCRSPALMEAHFLVLFAACLIAVDSGCRVACAIALFFKRYDRREKRYREVTHPANALLEHVPVKLHDLGSSPGQAFVDKDMLQQMD